MGDSDAILSVSDLAKTFVLRGATGSARREVHAVQDVSFAVQRGE